MKNKIVLLKDNKKVFELHIKTSKKSKLGDSDIMINPGKGMYFDHVVLGNYFKHYKLPGFKINSISWHGYYEIIDDRQLYSPVVHIKSHGEKIDRVGHLGSINDFEPFAFPVCSIYIPSNLNTEGIGVSKKNYNKSVYLDIPQLSRSARYDFFVLPKGISIERFKKSPLMVLFRFADLEIFNNPNEGFNIILDAEIKEFKSIGENDVLIRIIQDPSNIESHSDSGKQNFKEISEQFSIIVNDPNDIYNKLANRLVISSDENGNLMKPRLLKDLHEEEMGLELSNSKVEIWDDFYK